MNHIRYNIAISENMSFKGNIEATIKSRDGTNVDTGIIDTSLNPDSYSNEDIFAQSIEVVEPVQIYI